MRYQLAETDRKTLLREARTYKDLSEVVTREFRGQKAWILFWEDYRVDFARFSENKILWPENQPADKKFFQEARIFNEQTEVYIRNENREILTGRILKEEAESSSQKETIYSMTAEHFMWGTQFRNGFVQEERGMRYHLPGIENPEGRAWGYQIIQYYVPDPEDGMLLLADYRLAGLFRISEQGKQILD